MGGFGIYCLSLQAELKTYFIDKDYADNQYQEACHRCGHR